MLKVKKSVKTTTCKVAVARQNSSADCWLSFQLRLQKCEVKVRTRFLIAKKMRIIHLILARKAKKFYRKGQSKLAKL